MTTPASSTEAPRLEVHVLGGSKGESIVLKLPDGRWGVVDCCSESISDANANPTTRFLRGRGVDKLFFVCLTHPHDDHFLGMSKLIEEFEPEEFWRFGCLGHEHIVKLLTYHAIKAKKTPENKELSSSSEELNAVFDVVFDRVVNKRVMSGCRANSRTVLHPSRPGSRATYTIECLSPTLPQTERYERAIVNCIGPDNQIAKTLPRSRHNDISLVLKITYGKTKIILGGDLEKPGWEDVVKETGATRLSALAVKVSHHGSENGYCDGLWGHFSREGRPIAVVTPYHRHSLPKPSALDHISPHAREIFSTCPPRLGWTAPASSGAAPLESRLLIRRSFSAIPEAGMRECGRCTLIIDDEGGVVVEIEPPGLSLSDVV